MKPAEIRKYFLESTSFSLTLILDRKKFRIVVEIWQLIGGKIPERILQKQSKSSNKFFGRQSFDKEVR